MRCLLLLALTALTTAVMAQTAVYKWVDKTGHVHYSSVPPSASLAPTSIVNTATDEQAPSVTTAPALSTTQAADKALTTAEPGDTKTCTAARATLSKYLGATYLYTLDKNGKQQKLSKDQQAQALAEARDNAGKTCSPSGFQP